MEMHQVNVAFPEALYQQFVRLVPAGERTRFLTRLTEAGLQQLMLQQALTKTFGAWTQHPHPELKAGAQTYVRSLRRARRSAK